MSSISAPIVNRDAGVKRGIDSIGFAQNNPVDSLQATYLSVGHRDEHLVMKPLQIEVLFRLLERFWTKSHKFRVRFDCFVFLHIHRIKDVLHIERFTAFRIAECGVKLSFQVKVNTRTNGIMPIITALLLNDAVPEDVSTSSIQNDWRSVNLLFRWFFLHNRLLLTFLSRRFACCNVFLLILLLKFD